MTLERFENENEASFIFRVCEAKTTETWDEIGQFLNEKLGYNYSSSKYRKAYQSATKMIDANQDKFYDIDSKIEELETLKDEIKKERIKNQTLNIERNRLDRQNARWELFYEQIGKHIQEVTPPVVKSMNCVSNDKKYILTIADIHDGVEFVSINNKYNSQIVEDRFAKLLSETIKFVTEHNLEEITVIGLGDFVNGVLRANDLRVNDTAVVKSCVHVSNLMINFLNELSAYVKIAYYDTIYANHSQIRYLGTKANAMLDEDLGYIIANYIKTGLQHNNRVEVILPSDNDTFVEIKNIFDFTIFAGHGHQIKNIGTAISDLSMQRRKYIDILFLGHFHGGKEIILNEAVSNNVECIVCSAFIGSDPYSDSLYTGCKASCGIYGIDKKYGHTETYKIILN